MDGCMTRESWSCGFIEDSHNSSKRVKEEWVDEMTSCTCVCHENVHLHFKQKEMNLIKKESFRLQQL
jgi:hypothetical protein